jgi:hypothetical protein
MAGGAQDDNFFLTSSHGGLLVIHPPPLDFHGAGGRERHPCPVNVAVEAMAGGAQDDLEHMPMWSRSKQGKSRSMCEVLCATPSA